MRITVEEVEKFKKELIAEQYKYSKPSIQDTPWGSKDMSIHGPFGNKLVFTNAISS